MTGPSKLGPCVYLISPYRGVTGSPEEISRNIRYLYACAQDCLSRGEAPFAAHGWFPLFLDDTVVDQRAIGMAAAKLWQAKSDRSVAYVNLGISNGMQEEIDNARQLRQDLSIRSLEWWQ